MFESRRIALAVALRAVALPFAVAVWVGIIALAVVEGSSPSAGEFRGSGLAYCIAD